MRISNGFQRLLSVPEDRPGPPEVMLLMKKTEVLPSESFSWFDLQVDSDPKRIYGGSMAGLSG